MKISAIIRLLILSVGFTISLLILRIIYSGSFMYIFFAWNLFLAVIPLAISTFLVQTKFKNSHWLILIVWLIFFPNAPYIITDLVHLKERYPVPLWFDIILIFSAATNGLIMAYVSLRQVESFLTTKMSRPKTNLVLLGCLFLSSFGIYLGRVLRWNSWDILLNPFDLTLEIIHQIINPFRYSATWQMTIVLTIFFSIFYVTIKKLSALMLKGEV